MKAVILGSNGYLGQNLTLYLLRNGVEVVCIDKHAESMLPVYSEFRFSYVCLDITDQDAVAKFNWGSDIVFILAGLTGTKLSVEKAKLFTEVNQIGLLNILDVLRIQQVKARIVFPSTRLVYKGSDSLLNENSELQFKTVYAVNKYSCEKILDVFSKYYGLVYTIFRICVLYGTIGPMVSSYGTVDFMTGQAQKGPIVLYGDGSQRRTFVHVGDVCKILYEASLQTATQNDVFNIGGENFSLLQIAKMIAHRYGSQVQFTQWPEADLMLESGSTVFDDAKLKMATGIECDFRFQSYLETISVGT